MRTTSSTEDVRMHRAPAPLPLGACDLSSQPPLFSPNQDETGSYDIDVLSFLLES